MNYWLIWLVIIILLTIIETMTINLVSIWFIASAILSLIVSFFTEDIISQFAIFVLGGLLFMILTKPLIEELKKNKNEKLNIERIIGMTGLVTQEILKNKIGEVKVDGKLWSAVADGKIAVNSEVLVNNIDGVKLIVSKIEPKKRSKNTKKDKKKEVV